jgi:hypothetical protein
MKVSDAATQLLAHLAITHGCRLDEHSPNPSFLPLGAKRASIAPGGALRS